MIRYAMAKAIVGRVFSSFAFATNSGKRSSSSSHAFLIPSSLLPTRTEPFWVRNCIHYGTYAVSQGVPLCLKARRWRACLCSTYCTVDTSVRCVDGGRRTACRSWWCGPRARVLLGSTFETWWCLADRGSSHRQDRQFTYTFNQHRSSLAPLPR